MLAASLFLKGGVKDNGWFMLERYQVIGEEMTKLSKYGLSIDVNEKFYYNIHCRWLWICDSPAKHCILGIRSLTSKFALLPQVHFVNLTVDGEPVPFIYDDVLALLLNPLQVFTPIEFKKRKAIGSLPGGCYAVLLDNELNQPFVDKVDNYINGFPELAQDSAQVQHEVRIMKADMLKQPQIRKPLPYAFHYVLPLLHMDKIVLSHDDHAAVNYFIFMSDVSVPKIEQLVQAHVEEHVVLRKFETWKNANYSEVHGKLTGNARFSFGNLNKRQSFKVYEGFTKWLIEVDCCSQKDVVHFYVAWSLALRVRITECMKIYLQRSFRTSEQKQLLDRAQELNQIILRLVLRFFPTHVKFFYSCSTLFCFLMFFLCY